MNNIYIDTLNNNKILLDKNNNGLILEELSDLVLEMLIVAGGGGGGAGGVKNRKGGGGAGGAVYLAIRTVTANTTILSTDYTVICSATTEITVTMPAATSTNLGQVIRIVSNNEYNVILAKTYIDYACPYTLKIQAGGYVELQSDGSDWQVINHNSLICPVPS